MNNRLGVGFLVSVFFCSLFQFIPSSAITLGCSKAQREAQTFSARFETNRKLEINLFNKASYKDAYGAFYKAQINYKKLYDTVLKSPKCFSVDERKYISQYYKRFYNQIGACELYGIRICTLWIKVQNLDPCSIYKSAREYQDCLEDNARPTDPGYVD